jgi:hypothetical protein
MKASRDEIKAILVLAFLSVLVFFLTGCATPQKEVVVKTEVKVITTPVSLLAQCPVTAPPSREAYRLLNFKERESKLTLYIVDLLKDLKTCNDQINSIDTYQKNEVEIYKKVKESK